MLNLALDIKDHVFVVYKLHYMRMHRQEFTFIS